MPRLVSSAMIAMLAVAAGFPVLAQSTAPPSVAQAHASASLEVRVPTLTARPLFTIGKWAVGVDTPMAPPYANSSLTNINGQPGHGADTLLYQSVGR